MLGLLNKGAGILFRCKKDAATQRGILKRVRQKTEFAYLNK
jgi:hypothetical protein